jgi:hypothetical protein
MPIKHSKFKNTGVLFELLVRQTTSDLLNNSDSKAVKIIKKYFNNTELGKEYALYNMCVSSKKLSESKAELLLSTVTEEHKKLNKEAIDKEKYNLIKEIKNNYDIEEFFKAKIYNYKQYASAYIVFESVNSKKSDPKQLLANKINLLEHITKQDIKNKQVPYEIFDSLIKEDKEVRLLSYKIIVEKFNDRYKSMTPDQKDILKEYVSSIADSVKLKEFLNDKIKDVRDKLSELSKIEGDPVMKIKLTEILNLIKPMKDTLAIKDETITGILKCYDLIEELKNIK